MSVYQFPMAFPSSGTTLAGRVYRNVDNLSDPQPTVIATGAWLTVKEQMAHAYAVELAQRGLTVFTFDFAGFGQSDGAPRQVELPARKIADIIAAAEFLSSLAFVQGGGVGYLGICASAQYALAAIARGARIRSFASVAGWFHDPESLSPFYGGAKGVALRVGRASEALDTFAKSRDVVMVPAYKAGDDRAGIFFELDYYANPKRGAVPEWKNEMAEMSWLYWFTFDGMRAAREVKVPTLLVQSDGAVFPDHAKAIHAALGGPKRLEWAEGNQIDFYDQPALVKRAVAAAEEHFRATLRAD